MPSQSYVVWINKGGTGKTTLTFQLSAAYAYKHKKDKVVVIDMCPRANVSDTLLKSHGSSKAELEELSIDSIALNRNTYNKTVSGYLLARLDRHDMKKFGVENFLTMVHQTNQYIPANLFLLRGGVFLGELAKRLEQERQLQLTPHDDNPWKRVTHFIKDFMEVLSENDPSLQYVFFIDAETSFSIYTQMALMAAERMIVPLTADEFSLSAMGSIQKVDTFKLTDILGTEVPKLHLLVFNRFTFYGEKPCVNNAAIRKKLEESFLKGKAIDKLRVSGHLTENADLLEEYICDVHDFHSEAIQSLCSGRPISRIYYGLQDPRLKYCDDIEKICNML